MVRTSTLTLLLPARKRALPSSVLMRRVLPSSFARPSNSAAQQLPASGSMPDWHSALRNALSQRTAKPIAADPALINDSLHAYQKAAVNFALARGVRVILGHEMGLGKTPMAITIVAHCLKAGKGPVLVVAPPVLLEQWRSEILHWLPDLMRSDIQVIRKGADQPDPDAKFVIISYPILAGTKNQPNLHLRVTASGQRFDVIVVDEAHALKSSDSNRTLALVPMLRASTHVILMTGTPLANACATDVYPLLDGICGGLDPLAMPSLRQWNQRYCLEARKVWCGRRAVEKWVGVSDTHGEELHSLLGKVMVRKRKEEVLHELPPKRRSKVVLQLKPGELKAVRKQMALVGDIEAGLSGSGDRNTGRSSGAGSARRADGLTDAGDGADDAMDDSAASQPSPEVMALFKVLADAKASAVCEWLENTLLDGSDARSRRKVLIFAHHHSVHDAISAVMAKALTPDEYIHITGRTPPSERTELLAKFQAEPRCRCEHSVP